MIKIHRNLVFFILFITLLVACKSQKSGKDISANNGQSKMGSFQPNKYGSQVIMPDIQKGAVRMNVFLSETREKNFRLCRINSVLAYGPNYGGSLPVDGDTIWVSAVPDTLSGNLKADVLFVDEAYKNYKLAVLKKIWNE